MDANWKLKLGNRKQGSIAVVVALALMLVLIPMVGLVVDLGYMYSVKAQLQNAADAAALAGAAHLYPGRPILYNYSAHHYAKLFSDKNYAAGEKLVVAANYTNNPDGDSVVGCWTGGTDIDTTSSCTEPNAVKVIARRTDESGDGVEKSQPKPVSIFLGRILGDKWKQMSVKASAIAYLKKVNVVPMAVNEYWAQKESPGNRPYGASHNYPNSFVRRTNVGGSTSLLFGKTFAIFGSNADNNNTPSNPNGFVALNYRTTNYDGTGTWYKINTTYTGPSDCTACSSGAFDMLLSVPSLNSSPVKDEALSYLIGKDGYPEIFIMPTAVKETEVLPHSNYPTPFTTVKPTSACPYATVGYLAGGGQNPTSSTDFIVGDKLVTAVYDGNVQNAGAGTPDVVTIVGYALIQIDGYSSKNPKQLLNPNFFDGTKHTLYGHALDFVEPSSVTTPPGTCNDTLFINLRNMRYSGGTPHLVK